MTIDFGIDLGTTNSCVAVLKGTDTEVIKNDEQIDITPSVVWLDRNETFQIGRRAKERLGYENEVENAFCEFKGQMGAVTEHTFARNRRRMKPEELSAEVLKALKADVARRLGEDLQAAVITVPAAFDTSQCNATMRAGQLAGIKVCPLLQEPVAAAMAYGFQNESSKAMWLVYDLGGGTFDAAIIQVRGGIIKVVNHGGDNNLGGKLIDWAIVDELLVPEVSNQYRLQNFHRRDERWKAQFYMLKAAAEEAKIRLTPHEKATAEVLPRNWRDDEGRLVELEYDLNRSEIEKIAEPYILRTINICKKVLAEKNLRPGDMEKILLVGGPTQAPYLREMLTAHLGIPLEFRIDPMTIVARGAAIFAGTQRLDTSAGKPRRAGQYKITLDYQPIGPDLDPQIGGRVSGEEGEDLSRFVLEFTNAETRPTWRSGRIPLASNGAFMTTLWAEKGRQNIFRIELFDSLGTRREITPDQFPYTVGQTITAQILPHSIAIAQPNNEIWLILEKGTPLKARKQGVPLKTITDLRRGQRGQKIKIPIVEGEHKKADRNTEIGWLEIYADEIKRDVPAGSDIELDIIIDESRQVLVRAYLPILDEEFEAKFNMDDYGKSKPARNLHEDFEREKMRLDKANEKAWDIEHARAQELICQIEDEQLVQEIESSLTIAETDPNAASLCNARLRELKGRIDEIEEMLEWPALLAEAEEQLSDARQLVDLYGNDEEKARLDALERETRRAVESRDPDFLKRQVDELWRLKFAIKWRQPKFVADFFYYLESERGEMRDDHRAQQLIDIGHRAIRGGDLKTLQSAVDGMLDLLPNKQQAEDQKRAFGSTVIKGS
jgi:molecular chaperone DnaK